MACTSEILIMVIITQCLHAASFGLFHVASIHLVQEFFSAHQGRGQALYSSFSFGAGGAIGSLYSGMIWDHTAHSTAFLSASLLAFLGFLLTLKLHQVNQSITDS